MKKFVRQKSTTTPDVNMDFGAAAAKVARVFEPDDYRLRIESARVIQRNQNILIAMDLIETESGGRVNYRPLWVDGPKADGGTLTAENQHLVAQLLTLKTLPTSGNVGALIPQLAGLEFDAHLILTVDKASGRSSNSITAVYTDADVAA